MTDSQQQFGPFSHSQAAEQLAQHQLIALENSSNKKNHFSDLVGVMASGATAVGFPLRAGGIDQNIESHLGKRGASDISTLSLSLGMHQNPRDSGDFFRSALSSAEQIQATMMKAAFSPMDNQHQLQKQSVDGLSNKGLSSESEPRRVPCKARGMGDSHTSSTAYFDIPLNLQHGAILACSHPGCAASGRRFRYCQVCEVPVAKRNFIKRHSHGLIPAGDPILVASQNANRASESLLESKDDDYSEESNKRHRSVSYDAADTLNQLGSKRKGGQSTSEKPLNSNVSVKSMQIVSSQLNVIEIQWLKLLYNRPSADDKEASEEWMSSILTTAESAKKADVSPLFLNDDKVSMEVSHEQSVFDDKNENHASKNSVQDKQHAVKSQAVKPENQTVSAENEPISSNVNGKESPPPTMEDFSQAQKDCSNGENESEDEQPELVTSTENSEMTPRTGNGKLNGEEKSSRKDMNSPDNDEKDIDEFSADPLAEKSEEGADEKSTLSRQSGNLLDEQSQQSSVTTRPGQQRRRSVQDARKLMGLIKLSGLKEDHFDDMF